MSNAQGSRTAHERLTRGLARLLGSLFFREIQVEGADRVPVAGPLVYVANHPNSLVDPVLVTGFLPRVPRFLAKHNLWHSPAVRPFLKLAGSIPVYRSQDKGTQASQNLQTFDACHDALAEGAVIGIFPEGLSYNEPSMQPVKTGVARIVLGAEEKHGPLGVKIVPVGLTFDAKHLFRSRVLLTVGEPVDPAPEVARLGDDTRGARNDLTARVEEALRGVTLNYGSWKEARLLERAGDLYARGDSELPDRLGMADLFEVRKKFADGYEVMKERAADRVAALPDRAFVGGGSLPGFELDTWVVSLRVEMGAERFAERLRRAAIPVLARIRADLVLFDVRTLLEGDETALEQVVGGALGSSFVDRGDSIA